MNKPAILFSSILTAGLSIAHHESVAAGSSRLADNVIHSQNIYQGVCRHVVDGDSLYLQGVKAQIRLWGVDAPERDEAGYEAARQQLKRLALNQSLRCVHVDTDKYQRIIARCVRYDDQLSLNRAQIALPSVMEYCRFSKNYYGQCDRQ